MWRKLTEFIRPDKRPPRECEACGQSFVCGASIRGCWCIQIKLDAPVRQQLRERFKGCLCSDCLERFSASARRTP